MTHRDGDLDNPAKKRGREDTTSPLTAPRGPRNPRKRPRYSQPPSSPVNNRHFISTQPLSRGGKCLTAVIPTGPLAMRSQQQELPCSKSHLAPIPSPCRHDTRNTSPAAKEPKNASQPKVNKDVIVAIETQQPSSSRSISHPSNRSSESGEPLRNGIAPSTHFNAASSKSPPNSSQRSPLPLTAFPEIEPGSIGCQRPKPKAFPLPVIFPEWLAQPHLKCTSCKREKTDVQCLRYRSFPIRVVFTPFTILYLRTRMN